MIDTQRLWWAVPALVVAACATPQEPATPTAPETTPTVVAPHPVAPHAQNQAQRMEEAKALVAQAETDVQRARAKRALWLKSWENLVAARLAIAAADYDDAIAHARLASEFAQLGLEQLAYPAVK